MDKKKRVCFDKLVKSTPHLESLGILGIYNTNVLFYSFLKDLVLKWPESHLQSIHVRLMVCSGSENNSELLWNEFSEPNFKTYQFCYDMYSSEGHPASIFVDLKIYQFCR